MDAEVIVVGAGPTGLVAASLLGRYGVRTLVVDRNIDAVGEPGRCPSTTSRCAPCRPAAPPRRC